MDQKQNETDKLTVEISEIEIEARRQEAKKQMLSAKHNWRQKGGYITCTACPYPHGIRVNSSVRMIGISDTGMPLFERK